MLDYHLHLWEHGPGPLDATLEQVGAYCEQAATAGVSEIAITEHLSRFRQTDAVLRGWWDDDPDPVIASTMARWWDGDLGADLDQYVEVVLAAKAAGLPVVLGLEVDYYAGRMHTVAELLGGYPFDVLLGSVHWVGAWGFDNFGEAAFECRWETHAIEGIWDSYTTSLEELADSGVCDVLAHPDLCKISGRRPPVPEEFHARMAEAAARSGMAAEVNSAGLSKPVGELYPAPDLLQRFVAAGVGLTTASDAHRLGRVAEHRDELRAAIRATGCETLQAFRSRSPHPVPLG